MDLRKAIPLLLLVPGLTLPCLAQTLTRESAGTKILARVRRDKVYKQIPSKCLFVDFEEQTKGYFQFAVRFNPECCGVKTESTLLNRFAVLRPTGQIVYWDESDPESFKPYASFLQRKP
jgi:hypothetical protein